MKRFLLILIISFSSATLASVIHLGPDNFERDLNKAIDSALGETTINMPVGTFFLSNEIILDKPGLILRGQGKTKTILSFKNQKAGPQGIIATRDAVTFEDFAVEDSFGNGIKVLGAQGVTFRNVKVTWTKGPNASNGAYGVYPVLCRDILIENSEVRGASDAGIYVGQSNNIIVRNNLAIENVAGIEIENSSDADVYGNTVHHNTAGILVFNLSDLVKKDGQRTRIFSNNLYRNNNKNFSMKGTIINLVPPGMGIFLMASQDTEIFNNNIEWHELTGIGITNYAISERVIRDPSYVPMPRGIFIHENHFMSNALGFFDGSRMNFIIKILSGIAPKDIIYDGIDDGTYEGEKPEEKNKICIKNNHSNRGLRFVNLHLDHQRPRFPFPGGPVTRNLKNHECTLEQTAPVVLTTSPKVPDGKIPSYNEVLKICKKKTEGVNWNAIEYDCPLLSDYRLEFDGLNYSLTNELFTDYALKDRHIFLPPDTSMTYKEQFAFDFPMGTIITKAFSLLEVGKKTPTLIEIRLLIKRKNGWAPLNYTWDSSQNKAVLNKAGFVRPFKIVATDSLTRDVDYHVPNLRQCASCHLINDQITPIGIQAKLVNHSGQLNVWKKSKKLEGLPEDIKKIPSMVRWNDLAQSVDSRAKAYLNINCTHCHNPKGNARSTGLFLKYERYTESVEMGHCKTPVAAGIGTGGRTFDIQPGSAKDSILYYRMSQSHLAVKMPQLGRSIEHTEGNQLIKNWIDRMNPKDCRAEN